MNKLTSKERAKVYLQVAEMNDSISYACEALQMVSKIDRGSNNYRWMLENYFPEFLLFKPEEDTPSYQVWFSVEEHDARLNALLFAYHMALDAEN